MIGFLESKSHTLCLLLACLATSAPRLAVGAAAPVDGVLTTAAQVRALTEEEARRALPVHLRGIFIGGADPAGIAFVIQDDTDGIYIQGPPDLVAEVGRGDLLEIEGVTDPGGFAPYVVAANLRKIGSRPIPAPQEVTLDQLSAGRMDAQWVEVSGVVRSVEPKAPGDTAPPPPGTRYVPSPTNIIPSADPKVKMKLAAGSARVMVEIHGEFDPEDYVDAEVQLRGLCFNLHNRRRQFVRPFLQMPRGVPVVIEKPPPENPFNGQPRSVASLLQFEQLSSNHGHRVLVRGVVLHHRPGEILWIRDGDNGLRVESTQDEALQPGDEVDVVGFPARGEYSAVLEDAVFRKRNSLPAPRPRPLTDRADALLHDGDLVDLEAKLTDVRRLPDTVALSLDWRQTSVRALMRLPETTPLPPTWLKGSRVRIAGVCSVVTNDGGPLGGLWVPQSFQILLRSPADLDVLMPPPWWNAERIAWILSGFLVLALGTVAAVMLASRRRLREQEHRRAMAETEFTAILNERNRMAREIHDTLSQGLGAISVQLELARRHAAQLGEAGRNHVATAHQLARTALAEARSSIWNMRSQVLERSDLVGALEGILKQLTDGTETAPAMRVEGDRRRLPPLTENNLLRIGQEAITNACKHARASRIEVALAFDRRMVRLTVEDDGVGFTVGAPAPENSRSFGLVGIRERANLLGGTAEIKSEPGSGTRVSVSIPV